MIYQTKDLALRAKRIREKSIEVHTTRIEDLERYIEKSTDREQRRTIRELIQYKKGFIELAKNEIKEIRYYI